MSDVVQDGHFVGNVRADRRFSGLTLAETEYRPGLIVPSHVHATALVSLVLSGAMTEQRGRLSARCDAGTLIFHPPDEPHGHEFHESGGRCFVLQLGSPWIDRMSELGLTGPTSPVDVRRTKANWLAGQLYREFRAADSAAQLGIEGFTLAMLGEIGRAHQRRERSARPPWLVRATDLLHARTHDNVSLAELAAAVDIHPVHLSRTFRRQYGMTVGDYVRHLRIERVRDALLAGDQPLAQIALDAGFADQAHFSRVFKRIIGVSPGAFRSAARTR